MLVSLYFWWSHCVEIHHQRVNFFPKFVGRYITSWLPQSLHIFSSLMNWLHLGCCNPIHLGSKSFGGNFSWSWWELFFFKEGFCSPHSSCGSKGFDPPKNGLLKSLYPKTGTPHMFHWHRSVVTLPNFWMLIKGVETTKELLVSVLF